MNKIIKKTAIITLSALVAAAALAVLILSTCFPAVAGDLCKNTGFYGSAAGLYRTAYERSGDVDDYSRFIKCEIIRSDSSGDYERLAKYGEDVVKFKSSLDESEYDMFAFFTVEAKYNSGDYESSAKFAVECDSRSALILARSFAEKDAEYSSVLDKYDINYEK